MKKVMNAIIQHAGLKSDVEKILCGVSMEYSDGGGTAYWFELQKPGAIAKLNKLLNYAKADSVDMLNGKVIRVEVNEEMLYAFGDPIEDSFFKCNGEFAIVTEKEL